MIRRIKAAWHYLTKYPVVVVPRDYWTPVDSKAWSNFLSSDTGIKLRHLRWNRVYQSQQNAITDRKDSAYSAGIAFGILGMTHEEDQLLEIELPQEEIQQQEATGFKSVNR